MTEVLRYKSLAGQVSSQPTDFVRVLRSGAFSFESASEATRFVGKRGTLRFGHSKLKAAGNPRFDRFPNLRSRFLSVEASLCACLP
ncbi:hypothetical protein [Baaleninema sp.]|uniref:hypothetical protein n=1 Tax=Baaleninema sp. TaxID=3101197 RepID=UPI003D01ABD9